MEKVSLFGSIAEAAGDNGGIRCLTVLREIKSGGKSSKFRKVLFILSNFVFVTICLKIVIVKLFSNVIQS